MLQLSALLQSTGEGTCHWPSSKIERVALETCVDIASKDMNCAGFGEFCSSLFHQLCAMVPRSLRKAALGASKKDSQSRRDQIGMKRDPVSILEMLFIITPKIEHFDEESIPAVSDKVTMCILACLKYGIKEATNSDLQNISAMCLHFVRMLISRSSTQPVFSRLVILKPHQVHDMIVSHSQFRPSVVFKRQEESASAKEDIPEAKNAIFDDIRKLHGFSLSPKIALVELLLNCVSSDGPNIKVDNDTRSAILEAYDAGMDDCDHMLRRLMFLYVDITATQDEVRNVS